MISTRLYPGIFYGASRYHTQPVQDGVSKITAVLCKVFGIAHIEAAEDIVSETFQLALETWPYKGVPENPTAWLYAVAKNKFRNYLHRNQIFKEKVAEAIKPEFGDVCQIELDLTLEI